MFDLAKSCRAVAVIASDKCIKVVAERDRAARQQLSCRGPHNPTQPVLRPGGSANINRRRHRFAAQLCSPGNRRRLAAASCQCSTSAELGRRVCGAGRRKLNRYAAISKTTRRQEGGDRYARRSGSVTGCLRYGWRADRAGLRLKNWPECLPLSYYGI